eukprot:138096-Pyramimonas_sp.AAC.1
MTSFVWDVFLCLYPTVQWYSRLQSRTRDHISLTLPAPGLAPTPGRISGPSEQGDPPAGGPGKH